MAKYSPRYFKRRKLQHFKKMCEASEKKRLLVERPLAWKIEKKTKMQQIFESTRKFNHALVLDVDGTICEYRTGKRKHRPPLFRPYSETFLSQVSEFADLYLFSSMRITRLSNLWTKYFSKTFRTAFNRSLMICQKKNIEPLLALCSNIIIVDDDKARIIDQSQDYFVEIKRWYGEPSDSELLEVLELIKNKWNLS